MKLYFSGKINRACNHILLIHSITTTQSVTAPVLKIEPNYSSEREGQWPGKLQR